MCRLGSDPRQVEHEHLGSVAISDRDARLVGEAQCVASNQCMTIDDNLAARDVDVAEAARGEIELGPLDTVEQTRMEACVLVVRTELSAVALTIALRPRFSSSLKSFCS